MCPYWLDMCPCKKSLKVQEKSFQAFVCVYLNAIELKKERSFANLSHPPTLIWPQCLSPMVFREEVRYGGSRIKGITVEIDGDTINYRQP